MAARPPASDVTAERRAEGRVALATVLVVDDSLLGRQRLRDALEAEGFAVVEAPDAENAVEAARHESPDVVVISGALGEPPDGGLDAVTLLRETGRLADTPMLVNPPASDPHSVALRVQEEAIKAVIRRDLTEDWHTALPDSARSLTAPLASEDALTVCVVGIDDFHRVNYEHGQLVGLAVLRIAGRRLASVLDERGFVGRRGSEQFVVLVPGDDPDEARSLATDLRAVIARAPFALGREGSLHVTVSVGVFSAEMASVDAAVERATAALREAQHDGRDRVSFG